MDKNQDPLYETLALFEALAKKSGIIVFSQQGPPCEIYTQKHEIFVSLVA